MRPDIKPYLEIVPAAKLSSTLDRDGEPSLAEIETNITRLIRIMEEHRKAFRRAQRQSYLAR
jgi:hypothetical protein